VEHQVGELLHQEGQDKDRDRDKQGNLEEAPDSLQGSLVEERQGSQEAVHRGSQEAEHRGSQEEEHRGNPEEDKDRDILEGSLGEGHLVRLVALQRSRAREEERQAQRCTLALATGHQQTET
jgi:hypothetical protein